MSTQSFIPLSVPNLGGNELQYVSHAVTTGWVSTAGSYVTDFEKALAAAVHADAAVACQSGTAGLHISLLLSGVEAGDAVLVPTLTFIAAVNPVRYLGATPLFMDCDDTLCMDPVKLEQFCREECVFEDGVLRFKETGSRIRAIVAVHVFGNMADIPAIAEIAARYNLKLIEDATEALGTHYEKNDTPYSEKYAGTMGDFGVFSFNGNKIITTGGGGMILAKDPADLAHAKHLTTQAKSDEQNFLHDEVGYNYRLTNLQAAMGLAQLEQLDGFIETKNENYARYAEAFASDTRADILPFVSGVRSNRWFYSLFLRDPVKNNRDTVIAALGREKIQARPIWGLIHEQVPYRGAYCYKIEKAKYYADRVVNLPCSTSLTAEEVARVVEVLNKTLR